MPDDEYERQRKIAEAKTELYAQQERGDWSGLMDTSGSPIYTLREIGDAVIKRLNELTEEEMRSWSAEERDAN